MTSAVIVQMTTVSMNGSSSATMPSRTGYFVLAAACDDGGGTRARLVGERGALKPGNQGTPMTPAVGRVGRKGLREDRGQDRFWHLTLTFIRMTASAAVT